MSRIRIKNFGPIKEGRIDQNEWIYLDKVTIFIGNQGTGKSTIAKLISTLTWIEKVLVRGDYPVTEFTTDNRFRKKYCAYHRLENYFRDKRNKEVTEIEYEGDAYCFKYIDNRFHVTRNTENRRYSLPQIMYVPAERNFISTISNPKMIKLSSGPLLEFLTEFENAKDELNGSLDLPVNKTSLEYDRQNDELNVRGRDYKIRLEESSSGFQSSVPLFLVSKHLSDRIKGVDETSNTSSDELKRYREQIEDILANERMSSDQKRIALSVLSSRFNKSAFINIVEEPEQNLYPTSQRQMLNKLLEYTNKEEDNKLIVTTHSPYIISYLSLAIKASETLRLIFPKGDNLVNKLLEIVPAHSLISSLKVSIYELNEDGGIIRLKQNYGIPSDNNFLNQALAESNLLFDRILELEEEV